MPAGRTSTPARAEAGKAQPVSEIKITFDGNQYALDDFELGDLEWLEGYLERPLDDASALNSMKAAVGFVYLISKRNNPAFTLDDARKTKLSVLEAATADEEPEKAKRPPKRAAR